MAEVELLVVDNQLGARALQPPRSWPLGVRGAAVTLASVLGAVVLLGVPGVIPHAAPLASAGKVLEAAPEELYDVITGPRTHEQHLHDLDFLTPVDKSSIAICTIDVWQSIGQIGQMGIAADKIHELCQKHILDNNIKDVQCSATVTYLITQIAMLASLFSDEATKCSLTANMGARCSTDVSGLVALLSAVATHGQNIWLNCEAHFPLPRRMCEVPELGATKQFDTARFNHSDLLQREICSLQDPTTPALGRRLAGGPLDPTKFLKGGPLDPAKFLKKVAANPVKQSACAFNVIEATTMLSRIGININAATHTCTNGDQSQCAVSVLGIMATMGMAGQYISGAIAMCPILANYVNAPCAAAITGMVGALSGASAFASDMTQGCPEMLGGTLSPGQMRANSIDV